MFLESWTCALYDRMLKLGENNIFGEPSYTTQNVLYSWNNPHTEDSAAKHLGYQSVGLPIFRRPNNSSS